LFHPHQKSGKKGERKSFLDEHIRQLIVRNCSRAKTFLPPIKPSLLLLVIARSFLRVGTNRKSSSRSRSCLLLNFCSYCALLHAHEEPKTFFRLNDTKDLEKVFQKNEYFMSSQLLSSQQLLAECRYVYVVRCSFAPSRNDL
jgi:hypothetical protein